MATENFKGDFSDVTPPTYNESQYITDTLSPLSYTQDSSPPPSYESLYGRVKAAKQKSTTKAGFFWSFLGILFGTLGCTVCLGLLLVLPITMIVIGSIYLHECPVERFIPIYLIVAGSVGIVANLMGLCKKARNRNEQEEEDEKVKGNPVDYFINCFLLAWFIAGNVWVYRTASIWSSDSTNVHYYCHPTVFYFAFWIITSTYIIVGIVCFLVCAIGCCAAFAAD